MNNSSDFHISSSEKGSIPNEILSAHDEALENEPEIMEKSKKGLSEITNILKFKQNYNAQKPMKKLGVENFVKNNEGINKLNNGEFNSKTVNELNSLYLDLKLKAKNVIIFNIFKNF